MKRQKLGRRDAVNELCRRLQEPVELPEPKWTPGERRRRVSLVVAPGKRLARRAGDAYEELGRLLLEHLYDGDLARALISRPFVTEPSVARARKEICERLGLSSAFASRCLRVAAVSAALPTTDPWHALAWEFKCGLLPLLPQDATGALFRAGVDFASEPGVTTRKLRAWRDERREEAPEDQALPGGRALGAVTVATGVRATAVGVKLDDTRSWNAFLRKAREALTEEELRAFATDMRQAAASFERRARELLTELGDADAGQ